MNEIVLHKEKWSTLIDNLKAKYAYDTAWTQSDRDFNSNILTALVLDKNLVRREYLKSKFEETVLLSDSSLIEDIDVAFKHMVGLCLAFDYGPAGAWLGLFCEEVLGKYEDAQYWYNKAANFKCGLGMYRVGLLYLNKKVPLPSTTSLKRCFTDALEYGVPEAQEIIDKYF